MSDKDDWKGEALIKRKPTKAEQYTRGQSAIQGMAHRRRQANGCNMSRANGGLARSFRAWSLEAVTGDQK